MPKFHLHGKKEKNMRMEHELQRPLQLNVRPQFSSRGSCQNRGLVLQYPYPQESQQLFYCWGSVLQGAPCLAHRSQKGHIYPADEPEGLSIFAST